jgi:hypothetical protein
LAVTVGSTYRFRPTASDPDGDALTFSIASKPSWATFDSSSGTLSGTPSAAGLFAGIVIAVSDGEATTSLAAFSITVNPAPGTITNRAPTLSGSAVMTAMAGRPYSFQPTASDPDGDTLTFSIAGKPTWATFDPASGTLHGTPTDANVGIYAGIVISVSDGKLATSLPAFAITVSPAPTRSVTLNWTAPTLNVDGTALVDLAGYTISYGTTSRQYVTSVKLTGAGATTVVIEGLAPGTWYFAVKAFNAVGKESGYSGEVIAAL